MKISASIIVRNEEDNIAGLCESIAFVDEIVIVDSSSTDHTVEIARRYTDKIFQREWRGFKDKHEFADAQTTGDWIFWIDADERVDDTLREAILSLKGRDPASLPDGFEIARKTWYMGRWIMHSGWYPDRQMRLYRKEASYWDGVAPHQVAHVRGRVERLPGLFLHNTKRGLSEHLTVTDSYSGLAAEHLFEKGKRIGFAKLFFSPMSGFFRSYIAKQGFRDGIQGFIIAVFTGFGVFLKYAKIWELSNRARIRDADGHFDPK